MAGIWITTVGFTPCLPSLQTPIHKDIHKGGAAGGRPPFVERRPKAASPLWMGVWRLGRQGGNPTVVIQIPAMMIQITNMAIQNTTTSDHLDLTSNPSLPEKYNNIG